MTSVIDSTDALSFSIGRFLGRVCLWLIPLFFLWFIGAQIVCFPAIFLSDLLLPQLLPGIVTGLEQQGYIADIVTTLSTQDAAGRKGVMVIEANTLIYAYGLPLLIAMTLATDESLYTKLDTLSYGLLIFVFVHTWGICFDVLVTLTLKMGGNVYQQIVAAIPFYGHAFTRNAIALGYQLGTLILPAVAPIGYWVLRHQEFLKKIAVQK